jgi:hypothetical protein
MPHEFASIAVQSDQQEAELLDDLELRCRTEVATARGLASCRRRAAVMVRAANVAERDTIVTAGHTTEVRRQGAVCIAHRPLMVGSFFHLTFDRNDLDVAPALAICDRCAMLGETSFELGFTFVHGIDLPAAGHEGG